MCLLALDLLNDSNQQLSLRSLERTHLLTHKTDERNQPFVGGSTEDLSVSCVCVIVWCQKAARGPERLSGGQSTDSSLLEPKCDSTISHNCCALCSRSIMLLDQTCTRHHELSQGVNIRRPLGGSSEALQTPLAV